MNAGHYTCIVKNQDKWLMYDDPVVHQVGEEEVVSKEAYILFYKRRSFSSDEFETVTPKLSSLFEGKPVETSQGIALLESILPPS